VIPGASMYQQPANAPLDCCAFCRVRVALMPDPVTKQAVRKRGVHVISEGTTRNLVSDQERVPQTGKLKQRSEAPKQ
jgi:hypothetical protein